MLISADKLEGSDTEPHRPSPAKDQYYISMITHQKCPSQNLRIIKCNEQWNEHNVIKIL